MPPPLTLTTLALSPIGAIALDTPVKADRTNGTFSTLTSLFIATTPCCGVAWLSSNWMTSFFDSSLVGIGVLGREVGGRAEQLAVFRIGPAHRQVGADLDAVLGGGGRAPLHGGEQSKKAKTAHAFPPMEILQVLFERPSGWRR